MKTIITALLLIIFVTSSQADLKSSIKGLFYPKIEKFDDCQIKLKNTTTQNSFILCTDKYAHELDKSEYELDGLIMDRWGVQVYINNISSQFTINKVTIDGFFYCPDATKCSRQNFNKTQYKNPPMNSPIYPGQRYYDLFRDVIKFPSDVKSGDWKWSLSVKVYGFYVDY